MDQLKHQETPYTPEQKEALRAEMRRAYAHHPDEMFEAIFERAWARYQSKKLN